MKPSKPIAILCLVSFGLIAVGLWRIAETPEHPAEVPESTGSPTIRGAAPSDTPSTSTDGIRPKYRSSPPVELPGDSSTAAPGFSVDGQPFPSWLDLLRQALNDPDNSALLALIQTSQTQFPPINPSQKLG